LVLKRGPDASTNFFRLHNWRSSSCFRDVPGCHGRSEISVSSCKDDIIGSTVRSDHIGFSRGRPSKQQKVNTYER
jgi:hypothetical protein